MTNQQGSFNQPNWNVDTVNQTVIHQRDPLTWPLYINLPAPPTHFLGREDLLTALTTQLRAGTTTALSAEGLPGVGKTTLAVKLAHHPDIRAHFSDGVLWAGLGPNGDPALALSRWADALHLDLSDKPTTAARAQAVADAISSRKLLIVLDDIWQFEHAQTLRLGGPSSVHLLTTRDQRIAEAFGHATRVDVLTPEAARELFRTLAPAAYSADPEAADQLLDAVGYLPLAIELLAGYLNAGASKRFANRTRQALDELTDPQRRLGLATRRLGSHESTAVTLQQTIALSLEGLAEEDETAVAIFHALGAFAPKPASFELEAAVAVTGATEDTLALLADRNLIEIDQGESLALHQTLADVARTHTPAAAVTHHRDHYLSLVEEDKEDWQRISQCYPQIFYAWRQTSENAAANLTFIDSLSTYQIRQGLWQDRKFWLERAQSVAKQANDQSISTHILHEFGYVHNAVGEKQDALRYYSQALSMRRAICDRLGEATTLNNIGQVYDEIGNKAEALHHYEQSLDLFRAVSNLAGQATTLHNIGLVHSELGDRQKALQYYEKAINLRRALGDRSGEAATLNCIGRVFDELDDKQRALQYFEQSLNLRRFTGDLIGEAVTLNNIGAAYDALGDKQEALRIYKQVVPLFRTLYDRRGEATTLNNIGAVYNALGKKQEALHYYNQALPIRRAVGDRTGEAVTLNNIASVCNAIGNKQEAIRLYEEALALRRAVGDRTGEAVTLNNIGRVYDTLGEPEDALSYYEESLDIFRSVGDRSGEAATLLNIGAAFSDFGEYNEALRYYRQALPIFHAIGNRAREAVTLNNIGSAHYDLGRTDDGLQYYNQALTLFRTVDDRAGEAATLNNIGTYYNDLGEKQNALIHFQEALTLFRAIGDRSAEGTTLYNLAMIYEDLGDLVNAEELLTLVVAIDETTNAPNLENDRATLTEIQARRAQQDK